MTSERRPTECFVYITLPGQTTSVTAGRFVLSDDGSGAPFGRFVYGKTYLARAEAVELDPVELRLSTRTYETSGLGGVFGALRDAGPDHWGRRVIERNVATATLTELDFLLQSPDDRAGALGFGLSQTPPAPRRQFNQTLDLERLQSLADAITANEALPPDTQAGQVEELLLLGTSMGGARPKTVVEDRHGLWLAKLNRPYDRWNQARVEHAMLLLARSCGITVADSRVVSVAGRDVLLVKRFDRDKTKDGYLRARMVSALTLLGGGDTPVDRERWSYVQLAEELRRVSETPNADASELFRRMCFNALISNLDDHPRNHAVVAKGREWKLSPAYDLTPSTPISLERRDLAMVIGDLGRFANAENLLSRCARFLLDRRQAQALLKKIEKRVQTTWYEVARRAGVTERDCETISSAFVYPGFGL